MDELVGYTEPVGQKKRHLLTRKFFPSKMGGKPAWLIPENLPSESQLSCDACARKMTFLLQVYAPAEDEPSGFHRTIFVFGCSSCGDEFKSFRSQLPLDNVYYPRQAADAKRDFSVEDPVLESISCGSCGCPKHETCEVRIVPECGIRVEAAEGQDSDSGEAADLAKELEAMAEYGVEEDEDFDMIEEGGKNVHDYLAGTSDAKFNKFMTFHENNPGNILYYSRGGSPLWICEQGCDPKIPCCGNCGKLKKFEFQLSPALIEASKIEKLDFGVVAIFSCSCKIDFYVEESVIVQKEPEKWWTVRE